MERESFEDQEVAKLLNRALCEHQGGPGGAPDIDSVYMTVCQMMTGSGGWPLNLMLTPEKKPFFAGDLFPQAELAPPRSALMDLLARVGELWRTSAASSSASAERSPAS